MPRTQRKPAFALDRDVHADNPAQPTTDVRLPELEDLPPLPPGPAGPPSATPVDRTPAGSVERTPNKRAATDDTGEWSATKSRPRGTGGRQSASQRPIDGITKIPARVPADLYAAAQPLVKGVGKPSWGQLIAWTCQDHQDLVVSTVLDHTRSSTRRPRGQNIEGTAAHQVTARLDHDELQVVEEALQEAQKVAERDVTRTMVVIAALTVATRLKVGGQGHGDEVTEQERHAI